MKNALIFGAGGQDGHYLTAILRRENVIPIALTHRQCDVSHGPIVEHLINENKPDYVFHFAARSSTGHETLRENQKAIVDGSLNILESVKKHSPTTRVFLSGSVLQFDSVAVCLNSPRSNHSAYAAQRNASVDMARYYRSLGLQVYVGYFSHHDSPFRGPNHLAKRIAIDAVRVANGAILGLPLTDPSDAKEWNFAGDMMEAAWELVNGETYESALGSGKTDTIWNYAKECLVAARGEESPPDILVNLTRNYATESKTLPTRFSRHFKTSLSGLAGMMVESCRK